MNKNAGTRCDLVVHILQLTHVSWFQLRSKPSLQCHLGTFSLQQTAVQSSPVHPITDSCIFIHEDQVAATSGDHDSRHLIHYP